METNNNEVLSSEVLDGFIECQLENAHDIGLGIMHIVYLTEVDAKHISDERAARVLAKHYAVADEEQIKTDIQKMREIRGKGVGALIECMESMCRRYNLPMD